MPRKISELFRDHETGLAAVAALKEQGFSDSDIQAVGAEGATGATETGDLASSLETHGLSGSEADNVAAGIQRGGYLVTVDPPFGQAQRAINILKSFGPVDPEHVPEHTAHHRREPTSDDPAPLSNALGWRLLLDNPTPLSSMLGLSTLSKNSTPGVQLMSNSPAPISDALGIPTLIRGPHAS